MFYLVLIMRFIPLLFLLFLFGCSGIFGDKRNKSYQEMDYYYVSKSALFNEEKFTIRIDTFYNNIRFQVSCRSFDRFPFPKDKNGKELSATAFSMVILDNGKPITNDLFHKTDFTKNYPAGLYLSGPLMFQTDTVDLKTGFAQTFEIPMYAFFKLKKGIHQLELKVTQTVFRSEMSEVVKTIDSVSKDTLTYYEFSRKEAPLLSFTLKFRVNVPEIYSTAFYSKGIQLRNDSIYSPSGMDNTLWNSSYPDIYWTISYPKDNFYCCSDYQKSTDVYSAHDTFTVLHYYPNDSISIGVWDHDNFSRDDYLAFQTFCFNQFGHEKITGLTFSSIKLFKIKCRSNGVVN